MTAPYNMMCQKFFSSGFDSLGIDNLKVNGVNIGGEVKSSFMNCIFTAFQDGMSDDEKMAAIGKQFAGIPLQVAQKIIMDKVKSALGSLLTNNATAQATAEVSEQTADAGQLEKNIQLTAEEIETATTDAEGRICAQQDILDVANDDMLEINEQMKTEQEKIKGIIDEINTLKQQLASVTDPEKQKEILDQISPLAAELGNSLTFIGALQEDATKVSDNAETAYKTIVGETDGLQEVVNENTEAIVESAGDATAEATETTVTEAEGGVQTPVGASFTATGTAMLSNPVTALAAQKFLRVGADQTGAGGIKTAGSAANLAQIMQGIGGIAENTALLTAFQTAIGGALTTFSNSLGDWNGNISTFITSIGSMGDVNTQSAELKSAVTTDLQTVTTELQNKTDNTMDFAGECKKNNFDSTNNDNGYLLAKPAKDESEEKKDELLTPKVELKADFGV